MTTSLNCVMDKGNVKVLDHDKLAQWKKQHKQGEAFQMLLSDETNSALTPMALLYFSIRDDYAALLGYDKEHARRELEYLHGVTYDEDSPPTGRRVTLMDYHGKRWFLSLREYSTEELYRLVAGSDQALMEAST